MPGLYAAGEASGFGDDSLRAKTSLMTTSEAGISLDRSASSFIPHTMSELVWLTWWTSTASTLSPCTSKLAGRKMVSSAASVLAPTAPEP